MNLYSKIRKILKEEINVDDELAWCEEAIDELEVVTEELQMRVDELQQEAEDAN